jgi:hypothetical protein
MADLRADPADIYGTLFLCEDGRILEKRSLLYQKMCSLAKPSYMRVKSYFRRALNPYAEGTTFYEYLESLFCDVYTFMDYFPEYKTEVTQLIAEHTILLSNLPNAYDEDTDDAAEADDAAEIDDAAEADDTQE